MKQLETLSDKVQTDIPHLIAKTRDRILDKFEKFQKNLEQDLKAVLEESNSH